MDFLTCPLCGLPASSGSWQRLGIDHDREVVLARRITCVGGHWWTEPMRR